MDESGKYIPRLYDLVSYSTLYYGKRFGVVDVIKDGVLRIKIGSNETVFIKESDFERFQAKKVSVFDILDEINSLKWMGMQLKQK